MKMAPGFHISLPHPTHHLDLAAKPQHHNVHSGDTEHPARFTLHHAATLPIMGSDHSHYTARSSAGPHVDTPHPHYSPSNFIKQHGHEYSVNHSFRSAKHEASMTNVDTPIPELDESVIEHARHEHEVEKAKQMELEKKRCVEEAEKQWADITAKREAARHRSMSTATSENDRSAAYSHVLESPGSVSGRSALSEREDEW